MKKITIMSFVALLCSFIYGTAFAENVPKTQLDISITNGMMHPEYAGYAVTSFSMNPKNGAIKVKCYDPGMNPCPIQVTIAHTVIPNLNIKDPVYGAIEIIKDKIAGGKPKGKLVYDDMLYTWDNGVLLENGTFEMSLKSVEYNKVLP